MLTISPKTLRERNQEQNKVVSDEKKSLLEIKAVQFEEEEESNRRGVEDFIGELENHFDNLIDEQDEATKKANNLNEGQDEEQKSSGSDMIIRVEHLPDEELYKSVATNIQNVNADQKSRSTMNLRNSLTMKFLIETPRMNNAGKTEQIKKDKEQEVLKPVQVSKFYTASMVAEHNTASQEKKKQKSLYGMLNHKIEKIDKIIEAQLEIDPSYLNVEERNKLTLQVNKIVQKMMKLQTRFLE